jgi:hypothetical protein
MADVRYWHKADMLNALTNVRFWGAKRTLTDRFARDLAVQLAGHEMLKALAEQPDGQLGFR